ncbi:MAG: hypothetical protein AAF560_08230 [Acidobacteriota bacterium]
MTRDTPQDLHTAFQELIEAGDRLDASILEAAIARYPQFAAELTEFAVEWVLQDELPAEGDPTLKKEENDDSPVNDALARFRQQLELHPAVTGPPNPFAERSALQLQDLASSLGLDKILIAKLRDRRILAETLPQALKDDLASALDVPPPVLAKHLAAPAAMPSGLSFKSQVQPEAGPKESFADAVRRASLSEDDKARLLALD